jgi:phage head maturation protease
MKMKLQRKRMKFRVVEKAAADRGEISILGASFLNIDRGQEIIVPRSYLPYLERFSRTGKVLVDHENSQRAVAAKVFRSYETKAGLVIDSRFTGDEVGQWARERAKEGAIDTTSIGHFVHGEPVIAKEPEVRKLWDDHEYTPSAYDLKMLARGPVRMITDAEPVEVSFVVIPMNPEARVLEVKSIMADLETKKGAMLNQVNRGAVQTIYQLAKSILRSAKLMEDDPPQDAVSQGGPRDEKAANILAERKSRTDLLRLKLKLLDLESKIKRS